MPEEEKVEEYLGPDGKPISKSAWKKYQTQLKNEAAKKEKAEAKAAAAPKGEAKKKVVEEEEELDPSKYRENRIKALEAMKDPYPHKWPVNRTIPQVIEAYKDIESGTHVEGVEVIIAGRVLAKKGQGKLIFYDLHADGVKVQIMCPADMHKVGDFTEEHKLIKYGDIMGVKGMPGKSKSGELSVFPTEVKCLSACLHMLPRAHSGGLQDQATRYRQRYLDMICNPSTRTTFQIRSKIISYVRRYFDERGFLEVETPMMTQVCGGAAAKPFATHHNDLNVDMFMRIAPELNLKKLVVGGFDRVYEIGRQFRNEGIDLTHNPEFTSMEFYMAYADYEDLMNIAEELVSGMVYAIHGTYKIKYQPLKKDEVELDFTPPWDRFPMCETVEERGGLKIPRGFDDETKEYLEVEVTKLEKKLQASGDLKPNEPLVGHPRTCHRLLDGLAGYYIEDQISTKPGFITEHPQIMSPLAKYHRTKPGITERFEAFLMGKELLNAFTELNNPMVQRKCFEDQSKAAAAGDDEAQGIDEEFVRALEYGLPPTGGLGLGIDRMVMFLANKNNIKEVILFPQMKPDE
jgi:lysyl-tRNA synthetase class 2